MRRLIRENVLTTNDFIYPIFVDESLSEPTEVSSMPGVFRQSEQSMADLLKQVEAAKVPAVMLFGVSSHKDHEGTDSFRKGGLMDRMVKRAKDTCPDLIIMADACFCEYTDHGHCGPLDHVHNDVDNDRTIENIARQAVCAAEAGADVIAPSGMMDGQVGAIRSALDQSGCERTAILAYAAKYASGFYGPFRDAAGCSLGAGEGPANRKTYQMDPANSEEALREVALDIEEGADMVMVKPGLPYLDILYQVKHTFGLPTFAYNVSGEYCMIKAAARNGWIDEEAATMEMLMSFKRAGADGIITYAALEAAKILARS
ncbi:MAG: delta-aminolevulinic acid dehydratase [Alphaproteobacteria bacterium CG1_02_46_17]|nr:MAG: delta-aminolevulinic acid dehydratase [Alphaproteobacteria bacterium CG1_02_46_17]